MLKKIVQNFFLLICVSFFLSASESGSSTNLTEIDQQIKDLKAKLKEIELDNDNEWVNMQKYMIADWSKYAEEAAEVKTKEEYEKSLIKKIQVLEQRKSEILNRNSQ